jgi:hypothetical protein
VTCFLTDCSWLHVDIGFSLRAVTSFSSVRECAPVSTFSCRYSPELGRLLALPPGLSCRYLGHLPHLGLHQAKISSILGETTSQSHLLDVQIAQNVSSLNGIYVIIYTPHVIPGCRRDMTKSPDPGLEPAEHYPPSFIITHRPRKDMQTQRNGSDVVDDHPNIFLVRAPIGG